VGGHGFSRAARVPCLSLIPEQSREKDVTDTKESFVCSPQIAFVLVAATAVLALGFVVAIRRWRSRMAKQLKFYGFPEECEKFEQRHPLWNEVMRNLADALNIAFTRVQVMDEPVDKVVYFFGRLCAEDFMEITLVCYHGYGAAALKLVRTMYEYTVTLHYYMTIHRRLTRFSNITASSRTN
jgi:hypothetical protein